MSRVSATSRTATAPAGIGGGILLRLLATFMFALMALAVRLASAEAPTGQIMFWRSAVALVPIVTYLWWRGEFPGGLRTAYPLGHLKRSLFGCAAMFFSFLSLAYLPMSLATALAFLAPLLVIPAAMLFLNERPGWIVVTAGFAGFAGVLLMLWPAVSGPALAVGTLAGIAAGFANAATTAAAKVEIKRLTATEPAGTIAFYFAVVCATGGLLTWPLGWADVSGHALLALVASGLCGGLAHIAMTEALARAPASSLSPFEYTAMIWALMFDALIFALWPGVLSLAGALLIVAAAAAVAFEAPLRRALRRGAGA